MSEKSPCRPSAFEVRKRGSGRSLPSSPPHVTLTYHAHAGDLQQTRQNSFPRKHQPNNPAWRPRSSLGGRAPRSRPSKSSASNLQRIKDLAILVFLGSRRSWSAAASQAAQPAPARILLIPRCRRRPWAIYTTRHHQNPLKTNVQRQSHSRIPFAAVLYSHRVVNVFHTQPFGAPPDSQPVHCTTESLCPE
jgi:hypothetical protein